RCYSLFSLLLLLHAPLSSHYTLSLHDALPISYDYVSGYTIANDYAIRDYLENYYRPNLRVKYRDACTPIGPWFVDAHDVNDPMTLTLRAYINCELKQEGRTERMVFTTTELMEYLSSFMTLKRGDVILTGTPKGSVDTAVGDEVITEIEGIGRLVNYVVGNEDFGIKED